MASGPNGDVRSTKAVAFFLGGLALLGLLLAIAHSWRVSPTQTASQVLWASGLWAAGLAVGFLFGIPKILQAQAPSGGAGNATSSGGGPYVLRINTNLEEISDWLTKIIVGIGLVELKQVPEQIGTLGRVVARGLPNDQSAFGIAQVVFFCLVGFLFGYLLTRLYVQGALALAEAGMTAWLADLFVKSDKMEAEVQVLRAQRDQQLAPAAVAGRPADDPEASLGPLVTEYKAADNIKAMSERRGTKNLVAAKMGALVVTRGISRSWLAQQPDEVFCAALAMAALDSPQPDDASHLLAMAARVRRLHVRYKFALAISRLHETGMLHGREGEALAVLKQFEAGADEPLLHNLESVRRQIESSTANR